MKTADLNVLLCKHDMAVHWLGRWTCIVRGLDYDVHTHECLEL